MSVPQSLFDAVRAACPPAVWSRGIELTRAESVVSESVCDDEAVFRVTTRGGMVCPKVTLFLDDDEWDCECPSRQGACEHVAAAVIAWKRAAEQGKSEVVPRVSSGRIGYRFGREGNRLTLRRVVVRGDGEERPLDTSLHAIARGRADGPRFQATPADLAIEVTLGAHRKGPLAPGIVDSLFRELARCEDVRFEDVPVDVTPKLLMPVARVLDDGSGFRVRLESERGIEARFLQGVVKLGGSLRILGQSGLTERERRDYEQGKFFPSDAAGELVAEVLPELERRVEVRVETERLPSTEKGVPRARLDVAPEGEGISVLATVVYGDPPRARIDGGKLVHLEGAVPLRDLNAERDVVHRLREIGLGPGVRMDMTGPEAVAFRARLRDFEGEVAGASLDRFRIAPPLSPGVEVGEAAFAVTFAADPIPGLGTRAEPGAVLRAWRAGESLVPLIGGGFAPLPLDWLGRYGDRIADLLAARDEMGELPRACLADLAELCEDLEQPVPPALSRLRERLREPPRTTPLPEDLTATLRPYQEEGVCWLTLLRDAGMGALLADDMGLGKTLQALCSLAGRALVVAPTSVLRNWAAEAERHRPSLRCSIYHGPGRSLDPEADVTITSYALLRLDIDILAEVPWDTVILDEAQNIKNPASRVARAAFRVGGTFRVAMTGTPVENRLDELWSQLHFANPGLLGGRSDFDARYAGPIGAGDVASGKRLRARIAPFVLRRLKSEVARDLPPRTDMVLRCDLDDEERALYEAIHAATREDVMAKLGESGNVMAMLEALLRLRQACCHRALIPGQHARTSSKLDVLCESLDSVVAEGHKALVFSQWTAMLDLIEPALRERGIAWVRLDGSTRDRAAVVEEMQSPDGPPVMLISLKAGGAGLNLTAADHIFLLEPWWNPAVEDQAADRAHRIGQTRPVMVYRLVATDTVEERVIELQRRKRELADVALGEAEQSGALTREDLLALLT